ncbi:YrrS family protein [Alkalihalophilus lindianensis]|uniref:YrrS family protein n=1 Tax=Alkalihalophilus lindianensis TaxID=1630542 RepID=A0ABU3XDJ3_9BACI|nr:YrrS family protein [Alkalihalophilus lindianensis]MDV2685955.1 YrrS family protein [Alkalihalophilus lindianensis]
MTRVQGTRFEHRKKKRMNTVLNVAIGLVVVLIIVFAAQIFLGSSDTEDVALEIDEESEESVEIESESEPAPETDETTEAPEEAPDEDALEEDEDEEGTEDDDLEPAEDGEWEPVGTNQSGDFSHDFTRGGTNWNEMERALRYATGLGEDMITWRLENGGPTSVIGTVSAPDQQTSPYQVRLEWVDGQGWQPVSKEQLSNNPYRRG